jgi:hypothetical protein
MTPAEMEAAEGAYAAERQVAVLREKLPELEGESY